MSARPLAGRRVLDFGIITAGASTSAMLGDLGAEVIKVEGPDYIDPFRLWTGKADAEEWWNASAQYAFTNRGKRNLCVDLKHPHGLELVLDLAARCDIVVENFRVGVLERLGLGFDSLARRRPDVVMASISSQGATGPDAGSVSFGSTLEASSGLSSMIRTDAGEPLISGHALNYPDQIVSLMSVGMILSALVLSRRTQQAVHLDISQREVAAYMLGETLGVGERVPDPAGGRFIVIDGSGQWLAVVARDDTVLARVAAAVNAQCVGLDAALAAWVATRTRAEIAARLGAAGADVEVCRNAANLLDADAAGSLAFARDAHGQVVKGLPWRVGTDRTEAPCAAPDLGADNHYVAREVLDLDDDRIAELTAMGVLADAPRSGRATPQVNPSSGPANPIP
jgi:crotonobetainyl-CoA:carnitine CoA-transferase CaiB-like acyl-CoA transferase